VSSRGKADGFVFPSAIWWKGWCLTALGLCCFLAASSSEHPSNRDVERLSSDASGARGRGLTLALLQKEAKKRVTQS